ncbi:hypothetical protein RHSIM_Rhsim09G0032600 [Rhododendron simsii]|uniref:UBX domain-containing protein n=1 Tax=Rhododendron simsii TaxID=118357 RepID=A0A834LCG2_RHOSS|nr:hypothetical protein RHSIM_Rhsim09G0032600 [Rhododendron simsii]
MENSISALAYSGSISGAIAEAKMQKKLFVVYISGDNVESTHLQESTWMDSKVAESISKYCILLHISEGSTDAENFSAIYPQKPAPCITAIGYNGAQLWQNEGFVGAELLASTLEKAWLGLHIQETTATFLSAALASNKLEPLRTNSSNTAQFEEGSSSSLDVPSPDVDNHPQILEAGGVDRSEMENDGSVSALVPAVGEEVLPTGSITRAKEALNSVEVKQNDDGVDRTCYGSRPVVDHHSEVIVEASQLITNEATEAVQDKKAKGLKEYEAEVEVKTGTSQVTAFKSNEAQDEKVDAIKDCKVEVQESFSSQSTDVHLNIRLLDGVSLQEKFLVTNTLRMVKDYVDENRTRAMSSYDLVIPYPRKVFNEQDLNKTLSELGLFGRHALIVVPRNRATVYPRAGSSSPNQTNSATGLDSSNKGNEGYFAFMKRIISYANPLSYLGGGASPSNSAQETQGSMWEYGPNPALQNNARGTERPPTTGRNNSKNSQGTSSRFGSNIHTLKHDEDDTRFKDRNAFWNGNSTQYGGDNNDGK